LVEKAGLYSISTDKRVIPSVSRRAGIWILKSSEYVDLSFMHSGLATGSMVRLVILKIIMTGYVGLYS